MKKMMIGILLFIVLFSLVGMVNVKAFTYQENDDYEELNMHLDYTIDVYVDTKDTEVVTNTALQGKIGIVYDIDLWQFIFHQFGKIKIDLTSNPQYLEIRYMLYRMDDGSPWDYTEISYTDNQLSSGVYLIPGAYYLKVENTDITGSLNLNDNTYTINVMTDTTDYPVDYFNILEAKINDVESIIWTNQYYPDQDWCNGTSCMDMRHFEEPYISKRIYVLDREFAMYLEAMFILFYEELNQNYNDYVSAVNTNDLVTDILSAIVNHATAGSIERPIEFAEKAEEYVFNNIAYSYTLAFTQEFYYDVVANQMNDYNALLQTIFDEQMIIDYMVSLLENRPIAESLDVLYDLSRFTSVFENSMDEDDYFAIDFYTFCENGGSLNISCQNYSIEANINTVGSNKLYEGAFYNNFTNNTMNISSEINNDFGDFMYITNSSGDTYDNHGPIFYPYDNRVGTSDYPYEIEINDPYALDKLLFGLTAYDGGEGFLDYTVTRDVDVSTLGRNKYITVSATDSYDHITSNYNIYYNVYDIAYKYQKQIYSLVSSRWIYDSEWSGYLGAPTSAHTYYLSSVEKRVFKSTSNPEYYYKKVTNEYIDRVCFDVKRKEILIDPTVDRFCYYIDTSPSDSNNVNDYDYNTYYTSSTLSTTSKVILANTVSRLINGNNVTVYLDPVSSVSYGKYYVDDVDPYINDTTRPISTSTVGWSTTLNNYSSGDYYYVYNTSQITYTDAHNSLITTNVRYPVNYTTYVLLKVYSWISYTPDTYVWALVPPQGTSTTRWVWSGYSEKIYSEADLDALNTP